MTELFIPRTNNAPAKVKDVGLINLVKSGAGVYNAKSGEIILLPSGRAAIDHLAQIFAEELFKKSGIQCIDCSGKDESIHSVAERYVREYRDSALAWMVVLNREIRFLGWSESEEKAEAKTEEIAGVIKKTIQEYLPYFSFISELRPGATKALVGISETDKGAFSEKIGLKCSACGNVIYPDSPNFNNCEIPVNADLPELSVVDVHTPGAHTIPLLCEQLGIQPKDTLKAMLYTVLTAEGTQKLLFAMIRGDKNISIQKLSAYVESNFKGAKFRRAEPDEILGTFGEVAGFCGPIGVPENVHMIADISLKDGKNFVVGGNRPDYHTMGCCWGRDFEPPVTDLVLYEELIPCPACGGELREAAMREICSVECYNAANKEEAVLSCRDKDGVHAWPYIWRGVISLESLLLSICEIGNADKL